MGVSEWLWGSKNGKKIHSMLLMDVDLRILVFCGGIRIYYVESGFGRIHGD